MPIVRQSVFLGFWDWPKAITGVEPEPLGNGREGAAPQQQPRRSKLTGGIPEAAGGPGSPCREAVDRFGQRLARSFWAASRERSLAY